MSRILDLADESAVFAGRVLADLGHDVIRVEPPDGGRVRRRSPFLEDRRGIERSLYHLYNNANKRSVVVDLETADGRRRFEALARSADAIVQTRGLSESGLGYEAVRELNPAIVYVSVTPFGPDTPWADRKGSDLIAAAASGLLHLSGDAGDPPAQAPGEQSYTMASLVAATGTLIAIEGRRRRPNGEGARVDVSVQEATAMALLQANNANFYTLDGRVPQRPGIHPPIYECGDRRWVALRVRPDRIDQVVRWAREAQAIGDGRDDLSLENLQSTATGDLNWHPAVSEMVAAIAERLTADEVLEQAWALDLIALPVSAFEDMRDIDHFRETAQFGEVDHAGSLGVRLSFPKSPAHDSNRPVTIRRAPRLGEHTDEVFAELELAGASAPEPGRARDA